MQIPVVIFAYNRPNHLQKTLNGLNQNKEAKDTELIIFSDAPKTSVDIEKVHHVRTILKNLKGFSSIKVKIRKKNLGLANSIIRGVNEVLSKHDSLIVLEDDIVPSSFFLQFMNEALTKYKDHQEVGCIHAYTYPCKDPLPETFFLRGADCWGWGTWRNSWNHFEKNGQILLEKILHSNLSHQFDLDEAYPYTQMLRDQISGRNDSWAIRWHASMFLANKLCLYPGKSLVKNIGSDGSGTNCLQTSKFDSAESDTPITIKKIKLTESSIARDSFIEFLRDSP